MRKYQKERRENIKVIDDTKRPASQPVRTMNERRVSKKAEVGTIICLPTAEKLIDEFSLLLCLPLRLHISSRPGNYPGDGSPHWNFGKMLRGATVMTCY
jgi:hypothetical protein